MMKSSGGRNEEYYDDKDDNEDDDHDDDNATTTMRTVANGGGGDGETRRDATRPGLADPHILSMTGWLMAGWLAGQSVGRLGRALPTVHVPVPCSCRRVYATLLASPLSPMLPLRLSLRVSRRPVTLSLGKERRTSIGGIFSLLAQPATVAAVTATIADATPRYRIVSPRGTYGRRTRDGERKKEKKEDKKNER